ncbi:MAG: TIGR04283 family arsenosugar biosynthesis glycosyltransferase [Bacteroidota bacterium]
MESLNSKFISVVIPTLNEELTIGHLLNDLKNANELEIIVVDGGSDDRTVEVVNSYAGVQLLNSQPGRAVQLNMGATEAKGEFLWFLHADSRFEGGILNDLLIQIKKSKCSGSCFLKFDKSGFWYTLYSKFSKINWSIFTYGDQGIFVKRSLFLELGCYRQIPIMEDIDLVRRIRKRCHFQKLDLPVVTSARRFERNGVVRQELKNIALVFLYLLGISPYFLKRFY